MRKEYTRTQGRHDRDRTISNPIGKENNGAPRTTEGRWERPRLRVSGKAVFLFLYAYYYAVKPCTTRARPSARVPCVMRIDAVFEAMQLARGSGWNLDSAGYYAGARASRKGAREYGSGAKGRTECHPPSACLDDLLPSFPPGYTQRGLIRPRLAVLASRRCCWCCRPWLPPDLVTRRSPGRAS